VRDDGCGFDASALGRGGVTDRFGLFNIRERIKYLGGVMEVRSAPGKGTAIVLVAPSHPRGERCL